MYRNKQLAGWTHFTEAVLKRFCSRELESPEGQLAKLYQTSSILEYKNWFEAITGCMMFPPPLFLVHYFILGLRPDIKTTIIVHKPTELNDAIGLAHLYEQCLALERGSSHPSLGFGKPLQPNSKPSLS